MTENGRRARYYRLTTEGRASLRKQTAELLHHVDALSTILTARTVET
ncbi:MAG TPA: hypothetical protein VGH98_22685 [Gemmatimonadaceae bacterium]